MQGWNNGIGYIRTIILLMFHEKRDNINNGLTETSELGIIKGKSLPFTHNTFSKPSILKYYIVLI